MEIMTIPILCGELPKFIGAICYEGDKNVKRLEFTGAEPGLQYKLDMERTDGAKNVVDLKNQNGTLVLNMDGSVRIPAGRYQVQLRTIGDTVKHTNKGFLTVRDSIDAVNAFASGMPTEMEQMETRITDAMHRSEECAARAEEAAESVKAEVFIAEYGVTTWEDLKAAYDAGKHIVVNRSGYQYGLYLATSAQMEFRYPGTANTPYCRCTNAGKWSCGNLVTTATPKTHASTHGKAGSDPITPESIGAIPGYKGDITGGDLNDYTTPGNYRILSTANASIANAPFVGDVGTFLQVMPFNDNEDNPRLVQEAFTNKIGGVDRKWRTRSVSNASDAPDAQWSAWQDSCEVYIATYDESINGSYDKVKEAWNVLVWKFGKSDDGLLQGYKTIFCRYPIWDSEKEQYEYHMFPLSKITPNYISFRGMSSDTTMYTVYLRNPDSFDSTKWGWSKSTKAFASTTTTKSLQTQITNLEKRLAALEGGEGA